MKMVCKLFAGQFWPENTFLRRGESFQTEPPPSRREFAERGGCKEQGSGKSWSAFPFVLAAHETRPVRATQSNLKVHDQRLALAFVHDFHRHTLEDDQ